MSAPPAELDVSDGLRRRLAGWCETAVAKITENYARLDMHRAARNLITLFERIEDFEGRVAARREPTAEDREAVAYALCVLVRLLAPIAPHVAEELWSRTGSEGFVADAGWPGT
jgi:leucyl-tRNA synthetase